MKAGMKKMSMRRMKAMKVSKIAKGRFRYSAVFKGRKEKTTGGLKKSDLVKNKFGKLVSKKKHAFGKKNSGFISKWGAAVKRARHALGIKGFTAAGGKSKQGQALLAKTRSFYKKK